MVFGFAVMLLASIGFDDVFASFRKSKDILDVNQINEYSNYIHFQPEWKSYPRNLLVDVSTSWDREVIVGEEIPDILKHGAKQRQNTLKYVNEKPVVAVQYDYRDCESQWFHYAKSGLDFFGNKLEPIEKKSISNFRYSDEKQIEKLQDAFAQFVPICTSKNTTNFDYVVSINDHKIGFDVYFVPSETQQLNYFLYPESFEYYAEIGCYGKNFQKFSGQCNEVSSDGGLLIVIPDDLSRPMTKITVKLNEM